MSEEIRILCGEESTMAHFSNGQVKFLTFWQFIKLSWWASRNNVKITIESSHE